jgi:hypothetical protein
MDTSDKIKAYQKRILFIGIIDTPFFIALALGIMAYLRGNAVLPFLENETYTLYTLVVGAIGSAIGIGSSFYFSQKVKKLSNAKNQK